MRKSLIQDKLLPESPADFDWLCTEGKAQYTHCCDCGDKFSEENTYSPLGWAETQMSGICEDCFDILMFTPPEGEKE